MMHPLIHAEVARERRADLMRDGAQRRLPRTADHESFAASRPRSRVRSRLRLNLAAVRAVRATSTGAP
jgi:hypothetical protein